jgi:hypothetical protein
MGVLRFARNARERGSNPSESYAFARVGVLRFARNARERGSRAPGVVGDCRQPCGAAKLRVAASHQFASA